jgi:F420-non-reducing hydrogenase small subunit
MAKLQMAIYWGAACGGCDVAVLDLNERVLDIAELADIVFWPIALDFKYEDVQRMPDRSIDVCLFSGGIRTAENEQLAHLLRAKSAVLVALGACAQLGGIPGLANLSSRRDLLRYVYRETPTTVNPEGTVPLESFTGPLGELELPRFLSRVRALDQVVPVDYYLPGCPPSTDRLWEVVAAIAGGQLPPPGTVVGARDMALCEDCPRVRNEKRISGFRSLATFVPDPETCLLEQGIICCGPATRAGCGATCIAVNMPCRGCYGPLPGVFDQGGKLLSAVASVIDASEPEEIDRIVAQVEDPVGTFYRFGLPASLLREARHGDPA